jgi:hypothetical protein
MIHRSHDLSLVRQAELLKLSRSSLYYEHQAVPAADLAIMRRIDALHMDCPFAGSRMLRDLLRGEGVVIGRDILQNFLWPRSWGVPGPGKAQSHHPIAGGQDVLDFL